MMENGVIHYFPFAFKMVIAVYIIAFLSRMVRNFLAPVAENEKPYWYFMLGRLTLSTLILVMPFAYDHYVPEVAGDIRWYMMHGAGLGLVCLFFIHLAISHYKERHVDINLKLPFTAWMVVITVLFGFLTLSWGISLPNNWWFLKNLVGYALIFSFALHLRHEQWFKNLIWLLAIGLCFNAFLGVLQFFAVTDEQIAAYIPFVDKIMFLNFFQQSAPPAGAFSNKNLAASYTVMCLPLMAYLMFTAKNNIRLILASLSFTLAGIFLLYTRSRGSWVSALAVIAFAGLWIALNKEHRHILKHALNKKRIIAFVTSLFIIMGAGTLQSRLNSNGHIYHSMGSTVTEQFGSINDITKKELSVRTAYNINGVNILLENPLGVGLGGFHTIYPKYFKSTTLTPKQGYNLGARPRRMHNDMFQAFVELGVLGGLAHLLIFLSPLVMVWKLSKNKNVTEPNQAFLLFVLLGIGGMFVNSLGDFPLQMPTAPGVLWLLVGIITSFYVIHTHKTQYGKNIHLPIPAKFIWGPVAVLSLTVFTFITYDNTMRREGTLYLKTALGLSRAGQNIDATVYFMNKSHNLYALNARGREMLGVIYTSHKNDAPGNKIKLTYEQRVKALEEALAYDPYAQNLLINIAMVKIKRTQELIDQNKLPEATAIIKEALVHAQQAVQVSHYMPNAHTVYGITLLYLSFNQQAYNNFKKALEIDPNFAPAKRYIENLKPLIKNGAIKP